MSRDALGGGSHGADARTTRPASRSAPPARDPDVTTLDLVTGAPTAGAAPDAGGTRSPEGGRGDGPGRTRRRRGATAAGVAVLLAAAFVAGERVGGGADVPTGSTGTGVGAGADTSGAPDEPLPGTASPAAYAQLFPDEDDRRAATVVVSWGGFLEIGVDTRVVVAVVADEDTDVVGARLADQGSRGGGSDLAHGDLAREVLLRAGEVDAAGRDVAVVSVRGRGSGTLAVEIADSGYQLAVATAPRVHLAVVEGDEVRLLLAVPVSGPRPRA